MTEVAFNPAGTSASHDAMTERLWKLRTIWGGTETLKAAGEKCLPRFERESPADWQARLRGSKLERNMFRQAVERTVGRIFEVPTRLNEVTEGTPAWALQDNFDMRGNSFDRVARNFATGALKLGLSHLLVDYPRVSARNLAEERRANARPYAVSLEPEQVLEAYEDDLGTLTYLRWYETEVGWDAAARVPVVTERVHERLPGAFITWEQTSEVSKTSIGKGPVRQEWAVTEQGDIKLPGGAPAPIMLHTLYAEREASMVGRTPLTEVADLTEDHWQMRSDYKQCLQHVLFPIITATGLDTKETGAMTVGPKSILGSTNKDAKFEYLEHTGKAIEGGRQFLKDLEAAAEVYAGQLTKPTGDVKATQTAISSAETSSWAKDFALSLQDKLQGAIDNATLWQKEIGSPRVVVNLDFSVDLPDGDLTELGSMRRNGDLDRRNYWLECQRRNMLRSDFNMDEAEGALQDEEAEAMTRETEMMKTAASLAAPRPGAVGAS